LGLGHTNDVKKFTLVPNMTNVTHIACGSAHTIWVTSTYYFACNFFTLMLTKFCSIFSTDKRDIFACGKGSDGETGLGHFTNTCLPTRVCMDVDDIFFTRTAMVEHIACGKSHTVVAFRQYNVISDFYTSLWQQQQKSKFADMAVEFLN